MYAATRVALYVLGVRFVARYDWQFFHDPDLLKDRLWESLLYTHAFTPFMNLLAGVALKISERHAAGIQHAVYLGLGCAFVLSVAYLMDALRVRRTVIFVATALFCCSPQFIYLENLLLYEFPAAALLAASGVLLHVALTRSGGPWWLVFFLVCALIAYVRTTFHLLWLVALVAIVIAFKPTRPRRVLASAVIPLLLVVGLYAKNLQLFGFFGTSSWAGFNLAFVTTQRMRPSERQAGVAAGLFHPVAGIPIYSGPEQYARYVDLRRTRGIPVLDRLRRANGEPNYNHWSYIEVSKLRLHDDRVYIAQYPRRYANTVLAGTFDYFQPTSRWHPRDPAGSPHAQTRAVLEPWENLYNDALHRFPVVPFGPYALLVALILYAAGSALRTLWKNGGRNGEREKLLLFMVFNCAYVPALSCLVTFGELERYRFMVEGFMWIVGLSGLPFARARESSRTDSGRSGRALAAAACALLFVPTGVRAQEALWAASPAERLEPWFGAVRKALESEGIVVSEAEAETVACSAELARDAARELGARHGLCLDVDRTATGATAVTIDLVRADGAAGEGTAESPRGDTARATREAYRRAELAIELGSTALLRVHTTPEGALVEIEGSLAGHAPLERRVTPGPHEVGLSLDGFAPERHKVDVTPGRAVDVIVHLERAKAPVSTRSEPSPLNFIVGGALLVGAAPALALSLIALARDGDCTGGRDASGACEARVHFGTRSAVLLGVGTAALAAGGFLVLATPIQVDVHAGPRSARLAVRARF